jgi:rhodanese-related sulfurtransferase
VPGSPKLQQLTAAQIADEQRQGVLILDTRPPEKFASFHIRGALQLGLMGPFASWAAILIATTRKLLLVSEDAPCAQEARTRLARVGLKRVVGFARPDEQQWKQNGITLANVRIHWCEDLSPHLQKSAAFQLIDVRSSAEWLKGHLPGAISMPLLELNSESPSIDPSKPSLVYCHEGYRATTAASILLQRNTSDVGILIHGTEGSACGPLIDTRWKGLEVTSTVPW